MSAHTALTSSDIIARIMHILRPYDLNAWSRVCLQHARIAWDNIDNFKIIHSPPTSDLYSGDNRDYIRNICRITISELTMPTLELTNISFRVKIYKSTRLFVFVAWSSTSCKSFSINIGQLFARELLDVYCKAYMDRRAVYNFGRIYDNNSIYYELISENYANILDIYNKLKTEDY